MSDKDSKSNQQNKSINQKDLLKSLEGVSDGRYVSEAKKQKDTDKETVKLIAKMRQRKEEFRKPDRDDRGNLKKDASRLDLK